MCCFTLIYVFISAAAYLYLFYVLVVTVSFMYEFDTNMNKQRKVDFKKTLVRNTEKLVPRGKIIVEEKKSLKKTSAENILAENKPNKPVQKRCEVSETNLNLPELYSTLKISKKIDDVVRPRRTKSCSDNKVLAIDEKVSRKVNFPYDKQIYKDLIPLTSRKVQSQLPPSRNPFPQKDKEPVLSDFLVSRESPQYIYTPTIKVEQKPVILGCDNLRLYRSLQKYS